MKKINDRNLIRKLLTQNHLTSHFTTTDLPFLLFSYEKGELITAPFEPLSHLLFVTEGTIQIYSISEDGKKSPIALADTRTLLGDLEFCQKVGEPFFVEAVTNVLCLALPMSACREMLSEDTKFLRYLADSLANKLASSAHLDIRTQTVEKRLLFFMKQVWPNGTLNGIENAAVQLRCSRRQLQRCLRKLCGKGIIIKKQKGEYQISSK